MKKLLLLTLLLAALCVCILASCSSTPASAGAGIEPAGPAKIETTTASTTTETPADYDGQTGFAITQATVLPLSEAADITFLDEGGYHDGKTFLVKYDSAFARVETKFGENDGIIYDKLSAGDNYHGMKVTSAVTVFDSYSGEPDSAAIAFEGRIAMRGVLRYSTAGGGDVMFFPQSEENGFLPALWIRDDGKRREAYNIYGDCVSPELLARLMNGEEIYAEIGAGFLEIIYDARSDARSYLSADSLS